MTAQVQAERLLTIPDMCELLGISRSTFYTLRSEKKASLPPSIKVGRQVRFTRSAYEKWAAEQEGKGDL